MGLETPEVLAERIGAEWIDALMLPEISNETENPVNFAQQHSDLLLTKAQTAFGALQTIEEVNNASVLMIGVALHLVRGLGANPKDISEHWIATAKSHGALE